MEYLHHLVKTPPETEVGGDGGNSGKMPDARAIILQTISERLKYFETLGAGWAGPGTEAPDAVITQNVLNVLRALPVEFLARLDIEDDITPTPAGAIAVDLYANDEAHLSLEIGVFAANFYVDIEGAALKGYDDLMLNSGELLKKLNQELFSLFANNGSAK